MSKALAVLKSDVITGRDKGRDLVFIKDRDLLFTFDTYLLDRATCEIDERYLQLIPYVTLIDDDTNEILIYQRGSSSGESRLIKNYSIGFGGHIEVKPAINIDLVNVIVREASREIIEETGYADEMYLIQAIHDVMINGDFDVFYHPVTEVNKYHLCINFSIRVKKHLIVEAEKDIINKSEWLNKNTIENLVNIEHITLETWSQIALDLVTFS